MGNDELAQLGARWIPNIQPATGPWIPGGANAYITRLHVRYDAKSFPEDLNFIETADRETYQARYVMRHPYAGPAACEAAMTSSAAAARSRSAA